jgi:hypothetical protein
MCSTIESDSQSGSTQFSVVGGQSVITDTANRNGINTGCISITIAVVVCETTIACRPDIDVPLTFATLEKKKAFYDIRLLYLQSHNLSARCVRNRLVAILSTSCNDAVILSSKFQTTCNKSVELNNFVASCQQVVTTLLFFQIATRLSLTTC